MPSTYTPLLRLEQQADGENDDTWGLKEGNKALLVERAIAGTLVKDITGVGDVALTALNGVDDESRYAVLHLIGDITGDRRVLIPATPKTYIVHNDLTGAHILSIGTGSGDEVQVARGFVRTIICTGGDVLPATVAIDPVSETLSTEGSVQTQGALQTKGLLSGNGISMHSESGITSITTRSNIPSASETPWSESGDDIGQLEISGGTSKTNAATMTLNGEGVPGAPGFVEIEAPLAAAATARIDFTGFGGGMYFSGSRVWDDTHHPGTVSFQELMWPVGAVYLHTDDSISPATILGVGEWDASPTELSMAIGGSIVFGWLRVA